MDTERRLRVRQSMERDGVDLLVCRMPENFLFLSGHLPMNGVSLLLIPRDTEPVCIVPATEKQEAAGRLDGASLVTYPAGTLASDDPEASVMALLLDIGGKLHPRTIGTEGSFAAMAPPMNASEPTLIGTAGEAQLRAVFPGVRIVDATGMLYELRARKTAAEADRIRIANEIAAFGLAAFARAVAPGVSGLELAALVEHEVLVRGTGHRGARYVRAFAQVATGAAETAAGFRPYELLTRRPLAQGELALLELGVTADGYWSDRTRPRVAGAASAEQERLFGSVLSAQDAAIKAVRPGVRAGDVDAAARSVIEAAGLGKEFFHITGHGLGFRYHEPIPFIAPGSKTVLEEGMIFSVEPGIYAERFGGIRIEDDVLVTASGAAVLGPAERGLHT